MYSAYSALHKGYINFTLSWMGHVCVCGGGRGLLNISAGKSARTCTHLVPYSNERATCAARVTLAIAARLRFATAACHGDVGSTAHTYSSAVNVCVVQQVKLQLPQHVLNVEQLMSDGFWVVLKNSLI